MGHILGIVILGAMLALAALAYLAALTYTQSARLSAVARKPRCRIRRARRAASLPSD